MRAMKVMKSMKAVKFQSAIAKKMALHSEISKL